jgi:hypothetical protein
MKYDGQVLLPTLIGSLLSFLATSCVLISYMIYADQQRTFRHALVLNLALAGNSASQTQGTLADKHYRVHQFSEQLDLRPLRPSPS